MNLFVLPSWYPSRSNPAAGLFVREQVAAMAARHPDWRIVVAGWGGHDGAISLRDPRPTLRALAWRAFARSGRWVEQPGWLELQTPRLSWTLKLSRGGARRHLSATFRNFELAQKRIGRIDLVHAHVGFPAGWIAAQLKAEFGVPYVLTEHMSPFPIPELMAGNRPNLDLRLAFDKAAATMAVSPSLAGRVRIMKLPCSDIVPNCVDESRFLPTRPPTAKPFVFLSIGRLAEQKGMDVLLRALARWNPDPRLVQVRIGGSGPDRRMLQGMAERLGVANRVQWLGALAPQDVPAQMAACNALVLASRHETFGVVIAEAHMSGRPVLATRCGGPESLVHARNGILVRAGETAPLVEGLRAMFEKASRFDPQVIHKEALKRFSRAAVADQQAAIYQRVLKR
jgi:glycosyltransferase involved in cell wall biosynthesis